MKGIVLVSAKMLLVVVLLLWRVLTASSNNDTKELKMDISNETQVLETTNGKSSRKKTLHLLVLLPYPDLTGGPQPSWSGGPDVLPAIEMAVEDINRRQDILEDYSLDLIRGDSGCNIVERATTVFVENVFYQRDKQTVGIIGPACSASTLHTTPLAGKDDVALISAHGASTPKLEQRDKHPYVFGGFTSLKVYTKAITGFLKERQWTRVAVLYDTSRVFHKTAFAEISRALASEPSIRIEYASGIYLHFLPLDQIKDQLLKVTIILAGPKFVRRILCLSHHQGFRFPSHQFLIFERYLSELTTESVHFVYETEHYRCSKETMLKIMEGNLLTGYKVSPTDETSPATINRSSYKQFMTEYENRIHQLQQMASYPYRKNIMKSIWAAMWYDIVWAMAKALHNAELFEGVDLQTYGLGMKNVTEKVYRQFRELDFDGMSGRIMFDDSSFVHRQVDVYQINGSKPVNVAVINGSNVTTINPGTYTESEYPVRVRCVHIAVTVTMLFLASVILLALLITQGLTVKYRHSVTVKGSSPRIQHLAYVGCYLLIVATLSLFIPRAFKLVDRIHIALCYIMNICFSCGYILIIGTVCAKTWRLYRIFRHFHKPGRLLADHWLLAIILTLTLVDVAANIIWATTDNFTIKTKLHIENVSSDERSNTSMVLVTETMCTLHHRIPWTAAITGYNVSILIAAVYLAILTRKVCLPQFQTKTVVILAYILFLLFGLGVPLNLILDNPYLWIAMLLFTVLLCLLLLFIPPLLPSSFKTNFSRRVYARHSMPRPSIVSLFSHRDSICMTHSHTRMTQ